MRRQRHLVLWSCCQGLGCHSAPVGPCQPGGPLADSCAQHGAPFRTPGLAAKDGHCQAYKGKAHQQAAQGQQATTRAASSSTSACSRSCSQHRLPHDVRGVIGGVRQLLSAAAVVGCTGPEVAGFGVNFKHCQLVAAAPVRCPASPLDALGQLWLQTRAAHVFLQLAI